MLLKTVLDLDDDSTSQNLVLVSSEKISGYAHMGPDPWQSGKTFHQPLCTGDPGTGSLALAVLVLLQEHEKILFR